MNLESKGTITIIDEAGKEQECEILFTFDSETFRKSYVVYYLKSEADSEDLEVMASAFNQNESADGGNLIPIETDEEWEMIEEVLEAFSDENE